MRVLLVGAGGHASVCAEILEQSGHELLGCLSRDGSTGARLDVPVIGGDSELESRIAGTDVWVFVAIGDNRARMAIVDRVRRVGGRLATAVSPHAVVSPRATVGEGSAVMPGAVVNAGARLGTGVIVNTNASVDHDCELADGVHVAPGVALAGSVRVGSGTLLGVGAVVLPGVLIGERVTVGAGAVVNAPVESFTTVAGVPARVIDSEAGPR